MPINKTRTFSANIGDKSIGNAGPDAIENDIDNMMTNQPWNDEVIKMGRTEEYIPTTDYSPATKKYVDLHASVIAHAVNTNDYGLATPNLYGHVKVIDNLTQAVYADGEALAANQGKILNGGSLSSYMTFCINANTDSLDAAFGKNNTDIVGRIGLQLAMYAWFKGTDKATFPFTNLIACNSFQDCLDDTSALNEMLGNSYIMDLIDLSLYAETLMDAKIITDAQLKTFALDTTNYYAGARTYLNSRRSSIVSVLDASALFSKQVGLTGTCIANTKTAIDTNTNTILIPTAAGVIRSGTSDQNRIVYDGLNSNFQACYGLWDLEQSGNFTTGLSFRGMHAYTGYAGYNCTFTYTKYTVI